MSLKQKYLRFVQKLNFPQARPNPPGVKPTKSFWSQPDKPELFRRAVHSYRESWAKEFSTTEVQDAKAKEQWENTVTEQAGAMKDAANETSEIADQTKNYLTLWVGVYRDTLEAFANGYRRGLEHRDSDKTKQ